MGHEIVIERSIPEKFVGTLEGCANAACSSS